MFESTRRGDSEGSLAARLAIPKAQHPRVPEPTAKSLLADLGGVATVGEDAAALDALKIMAERDTAAVAVMSRAGLLGIFSERDHARHGLAARQTANDTPVVDIMSRFVASVAPADSVRRCLALMSERKVTHLAVLDQGQLIGLLSQADLLAAQIAYHERIFHETELDQKLLFLRGTYSC